MVELYFGQRVGYQVSAHPLLFWEICAQGGMGAYKVLYSNSDIVVTIEKKSGKSKRWLSSWVVILYCN